ncbi:hypothetical protein DID88_001215 [Monilinia fructigena]|uniref:Histone chaperone domain-containing protein n=1 Tax=Monilinia fructigena TaxID=38457 RepID=A0A395J370_9HELO|nr:hypothetical protein DID88_001215 [Monilinia fructigena]
MSSTPDIPKEPPQITIMSHVLGTNADIANSDAQLERDDEEAIDKSNVIDSKTRGAAKSSETYREPGDEEGLPTNDGMSAVAQ